MKLRIRELRKQKGWTVEQLADIVGLSKSYVSEIETGKKQANQTRISKFANAFGVSVADLLEESSLNPEDRDLLDKFHSMDADARRTLLDVARTMAGPGNKTKNM